MQDATAERLCQKDRLDPDRANALATTLDIKERFKENSSLPPFFHQIYFWNVHPANKLGRDGHPRVGGLIPDMRLPRRMWAGGELTFHEALQAGVEAERVSKCEAAERKTGRSGSFALVKLRHDIWQNDRLCVTERQDLVYLPDRTPDAPVRATTSAPTDADTADERHFDSTLLFRYSALTFNGHRIHYDYTYASEIEGYDGLVVHGPLLAQLLMLKAEREIGQLETFSFRATAPLLHHEKAVLCRKGDALWVAGPDGRLCMQATAKPRSE